MDLRSLGDVQFPLALLPCRIAADARNLKANAPESSTDRSDRSSSGDRPREKGLPTSPEEKLVDT
jgi:hypothetical protein